MKVLGALTVLLMLLIGGALYAAPIILNPSFEIGPFPGASGYGAIDSWTRGDADSGLNTAAGPFVNAAVPDGTHAAFLQSGGDTTISQSISGTTHTLTFDSFAGPGSDWTHNVDMISLIQVPEPMTLSLLALGGLALLRRR